MATADDLDLVTTWSEQFVEDADLPRGVDQRPGARKHIAAGAAYLWEVDERPVAMAVATGETPTGVRIGGVFTPRALRGNGYASACVARLTQRLFDSGRKRCFLYTDLVNPISNRIYARVGYVGVQDYEEWRFSPAAPSEPTA